MKKVNALIAAACLLSLSLAGAVAVSADDGDLNSFLALAADSGVNSITLTGDVDLNGEDVVIGRTIALNGGGFKITNGTLTIQGEGSSVSDLTIENATGDALTLKDSPNSRLQNLTVSGANGYGVKMESDSARTTVSVNLSLTLSANASGGIYLGGNSLLTLSGSTAVLNVDNYIFVPEAKEQAYVQGEFRDKNFDKQDRINVVLATENGTFVTRDSDNINQISYTANGAKIKCYVVPYDDEAPDVGVIKAPSSTVVGKPLDLSTSIEITDNRSASDEMTVEYTVTDEGGKTLPLDGADDVFVNGYIVTPESTGMLAIRVDVADEYGNSATRHIYIKVLKEVSALPTISAEAIGRTFSVGEKLVFPEFAAKDSLGADIPVEIAVVFGNGERLVVSDGEYTFAKGGVYRIEVSATDSYGNTACRKYFVAAVNTGDIPALGDSPANYTVYIILIAVVAALAIGIGVTGLILKGKGKKQ